MNFINKKHHYKYKGKSSSIREGSLCFFFGKFNIKHNFLLVIMIIMKIENTLLFIQ